MLGCFLMFFNVGMFLTNVETDQWGANHKLVDQTELNLKKNISLKKNTKQFNERDVEWESLLHLALLWSNTRTSTALQAFLHYVTLMNEAVMSLCSSLAIQLSSDSFMLQPLGCVNESVRETPFRGHEWQIRKHAGTLEFIPEGHQHSLWNTREWWSDPWRRCEKAKQREKENQLGSSSNAPLLPLTAICELLLITKQPTSIHRQRALGWICGPWLCTVRTANATQTTVWKQFLERKESNTIRKKTINKCICYS